MEKLKILYALYLNSVDKKFTDKSSKHFVKTGFSEWLGDKYNEDWTKLAQECGFPTNAELRRKVFILNNN
jgi:hypothetical protein